jgi:tRNA(Ile2) C34 agmatinyltransferase TiaS
MNYSATDLLPKSTLRPRCPSCGGVNPRSEGSDWNCKVCDRSWKKRPRLKPKIPSPPCIECGSLHTISKGPVWRCKDCGRGWSKVYGGIRKKREKIL